MLSKLAWNFWAQVILWGASALLLYLVLGLLLIYVSLRGLLGGLNKISHINHRAKCLLLQLLLENKPSSHIKY